MRPTQGRGGSPRIPLFGLAPRGVYRATGVTASTGGLLPHRSTLTAQRPRTATFTSGGIFSVALAWSFPHWALPSTRPVESRLSSTVCTGVPGSGSPASWIEMSLLPVTLLLRWRVISVDQRNVAISHIDSSCKIQDSLHPSIEYEVVASFGCKLLNRWN